MSELEPTVDNTTHHETASIYASFQHAAAQLAGLVAVDYFFAKEISQCMGFAQGTNNESARQQWFHLLIALSASLRDGHSCLPLTQANKGLLTLLIKIKVTLRAFYLPI